MKKNILLIIALASLSISSCKKDYLCVCNTSVAGNNTASDETTIKDTKKKAESACEARGSTTTIYGITTVTTCELN